MPDILVENVKKLYGKRLVLENISFQLTEPGIYLLAGPNGCGKTTLIEIIAGLRKATEGEVKINGFQSGGIEAKCNIGLLSQQNNIRKNCTVKEEMTLIKKLFNKQVDDLEYLKQFALDDYYEQKTKKLSGGLQRRLLIALTLMTDQEIIILDEPVSGLDTDNRDEIWNSIKESSREKIVLVSDHYLNQAAVYSDYIFLLDQGKIILQDKRENIMNHVDYQKVLRVKKNKVTEVKKIVETYCNQYTIKGSGSVYHFFIKNERPELNPILKDWNIDICHLDLEDVYFYYTGATVEDASNKMTR